MYLASSLLKEYNLHFPLKVPHIIKNLLSGENDIDVTLFTTD